MHITDMVTLIGHTTITALHEFAEGFKQSGRGIATIVGLDKLHGRSHSDAAMRISEPVLAQDRAAAMTELARIGLLRDGQEALNSVDFLERMSLAHVGPIPGNADHVVTLGVIAACRSLGRKVRAALTAVRTMGVRDGVVNESLDHDLEWISLSDFERKPGSSPHDLAWFSLENARVRADTPAEALACLSLASARSKEAPSRLDQADHSHTAIPATPAPPVSEAEVEVEAEDEMETNFD